MEILLALIFSPLSHASFTYEDLTRLIQSQGQSSIEEVLAQLPEDLRSNYALMSSSRSLQEASPLAPRVLLFGKNGSLTCSFDGDPDQIGYDLLECMQFRESERRFDFRQIQFPTPANGLKAVAFSASNRGVNGISCTKCHGTDPRPNWDDYNRWPGAFGEEEDKLEADGGDYRAFVNLRADHPRYRWLLQEHNSWAPYRFNQLDVGIEHRPNLRLTELFGRMNAARAARIMSERLPPWERWAYVVSALACEISPEQKMDLRKSGLDPETDLQLTQIFSHIGLESYEWSSRIRADKNKYADKPWEYQTGFFFFSESVAMALVEESAKSGNQNFAHALEQIRTYFLQTYFGAEREFYNELNKIVTAVDLFGPGYKENRGVVCPEAMRLLMHERISSQPQKAL